MQRNWASMWLKSQEQGIWPDRSPETCTDSEKEDSQKEDTQKDVPFDAARWPRTHPARDFAGSRALTKAATESQWTTAAATAATEDLTREELATEDSDLAVQPFQLSATDDSSAIRASMTHSQTTGASDAGMSRVIERFADLRGQLRMHRADLYLGVAVFVAALALLWPAAGSPRRAALRPWERALVTLGIAEAPAPSIHLQGDPGIQVWVDPHTALYYCPGEDQYGKTAGGRYSSQHDAQMDRFEPGSRSACE